MSLVTITTSKTNIANISTLLSELNIRVNDNQSTVLGYQAGTQLKGAFNTIVGYNAAQASLAANAYTVFGYGAGTNVNSSSNTIIGAMAAESMTSGSNNVIMGTSAAATNIVGSRNVYVGTSCARTHLGSANVIIGSEAGSGAASGGSCNVVLGTGANSTSTGGVVIGSFSRSTGRNSVVLGGTVTSSGSNCFIVNASSATLSNAEDGLISINGRFVGAPRVVYDANNVQRESYSMSLVGDFVSLCEDASTHDSMLTGTRARATFFSKVDMNETRCSRLSVFAPGGESNVGWTLSLGQVHTWTPDAMNPAPKSFVRAADLRIASANSNVVVFTDEFVPELFNFTAKHRCDFADFADFAASPDEEDMKKGMKSAVVGKIVVASGSYRNLDGSTGPSIDEALPIVELARAAKDTRVFGVAAGFEDDIPNPDPERTRVFRLGHMRFHVPLDTDSSGPKLVVNSLGEGGIWVCDANGPLRNGDFICSSDVPGYGMRQDVPCVMAYTVAKITCDCSFRPCTASFRTCTVTAHDNRSYRCAFVGCSYRC